MSDINTVYVPSPKRWHDLESPDPTSNRVRLHCDSATFRIEGHENELDCFWGRAEQSGSKNEGTVRAGVLKQDGFSNWADVSSASKVEQTGEKNYAEVGGHTNEVCQLGDENSLQTTGLQCSIQQTGDGNLIKDSSSAAEVSVKGDGNTINSSGSKGHVALDGDRNSVWVDRSQPRVEITGDENRVHAKHDGVRIAVDGDDNFVAVEKPGLKLTLIGDGLQVEVDEKGQFSVLNQHQRPGQVRLLADGSYEVRDHSNSLLHLHDWLFGDE